MRLIKIFGLAAIAAVAAMAFVGAISASAANTQLCATHTGLTCSSPRSSLNMVNAGVFRVLNDLSPVLCLNVSLEATPLALANPQSIHTTSLTFLNCGTNSAHSNCEITVEELPLFNLSKTGLDQGTLIATNGQLTVLCVEVLGSMTIECTFDMTGAELPIGSGHATASEMSLTEIGSDFLCPGEPQLDGLLQGTSSAYVLG